jgi:hypothetical protein
MIDYTLILMSKYAGKEWILDGDDYTGLTWLDESPKPSKATLDNLWLEVQAQLIADKENKAAQKQALLDRLGITADEAALLLS